MKRNWIIRCMEKAGFPKNIINITKALLINLPILMLNGNEKGILETDSGLSQGCVAACMLYIIAVDPLINKLAKRKNDEPGTQHAEETMVSAFVDDWSTTISSPDDLREVRGILSDFEKASGQKINSDKSALVPSCRLTNAEEQAYMAAWGTKMRVSHYERVLGVYIGIEATTERQYQTALEN